MRISCSTGSAKSSRGVELLLTDALASTLAKRDGRNSVNYVGKGAQSGQLMVPEPKSRLPHCHALTYECTGKRETTSIIPRIRGLSGPRSSLSSSGTRLGRHSLRTGCGIRSDFLRTRCPFAVFNILSLVVSPATRNRIITRDNKRDPTTEKLIKR
jgi:hypothetical protein